MTALPHSLDAAAPQQTNNAGWTHDHVNRGQDFRLIFRTPKAMEESATEPLSYKPGHPLREPFSNGRYAQM